LGQKTAAASLAVVLASDQSPITVSGPATDAQIAARGYALDGTDTTFVVPLDGGTGIRGWLSSIYSALVDTVSTLGSPLQAGGTVIVGNFPSTQGISGTVTANVASRTSTTPITLNSLTAMSAYASGNVLSGKITFPNVFDAARSGILESIVVVCKSTQTTGYKLYLFGEDPIATTWTNKTAPALLPADVTKIIGCWTLGSADSGIGPLATINQLDGIGAVVNGSLFSLYGILVCTGAPTYLSPSDLTVTIRILKD
jgi:hypothetical protein